MKYHLFAAACAAFLMSGAAAMAQSASVSELAAQGFEVKAALPYDVDPNPSGQGNRDEMFLIMQKDQDVFGCAVLSSQASRCQKIQ